MKMTKTASESQEQRALFEWAARMEHTYPELQLLHHIANEAKLTPREGYSRKLLGVKRGVPDICLPVARGNFHGLYIELKRLKGGRLSEDQKAWLNRLNRGGYLAVRCDGWSEAAGVILHYLRAETKGDRRP